ncbi:MAG: hypothetical protein AAGJ94_15480 [Pseudomonadota bacterium]
MSQRQRAHRRRAAKTRTAPPRCVILAQRRKAARQQARKAQNDIARRKARHHSIDCADTPSAATLQARLTALADLARIKEIETAARALSKSEPDIGAHEHRRPRKTTVAKPAQRPQIAPTTGGCPP